MKYKISVGRSRSDIQRVLTELFKCDFVFSRNNRVRDYETVRKYWEYDMDGWQWIITGYDENCKAVIGSSDGYSGLREFTEIRVEELVKKIKEQNSVSPNNNKSSPPLPTERSTATTTTDTAHA
jgi:hypothetical protein